METMQHITITPRNAARTINEPQLLHTASVSNATDGEMVGHASLFEDFFKHVFLVASAVGVQASNLANLQSGLFWWLLLGLRVVWVIVGALALVAGLVSTAPAVSEQGVSVSLRAPLGD